MGMRTNMNDIVPFKKLLICMVFSYVCGRFTPIVLHVSPIIRVFISPFAFFFTLSIILVHLLYAIQILHYDSFFSIHTPCSLEVKASP